MKKILRPYWHKAKSKFLKYWRSLIQVSHKFGFNSESIGHPDGYYLASSYFDKFKTTENLLTFQEIYTKHSYFRREAKTLTDFRCRKFPGSEGFNYDLANAFVVTISGGRVWGINGSVITHNDKLLDDCSPEFDSILSNHSIFNQWRLPSIQYKNEIVAVLAAPGGEGYFHWMFDVLPRLGILDQAGFDNKNSIDKFVVNPLLSKFHQETLDYLGITQDKLIVTNDHFHLKANQLVVPSLAGKSGHFPKFSCEFLRNSFLSVATATNNKKSSKRIYVARGNVNKRKVINESELIDFLTKEGFEVVAMDKLSLREQISLFNSATIIVSPHGAALTNLVFCQPSTKVIELYNPNYMNGCYWHLSSQVGLSYHYLAGEGEWMKSHFNPSANSHDIIVNIELFKEVYKLAISV